MKAKILMFCVLIMASSCAHGRYYKEPQIPFSSFARIDVKRYKANCFNCVLESGVGSGTVVGSTKFLTAGHICVGIRDMIENASKSEVLDRVLVTIKDDHGDIYGVTGLNIHETADICIMETDKPFLAGGIDIARQVPPRGKTVWSMMVPDGVGGVGLVPVVIGNYSGGDASVSVFTIPAHPGASGGPIFDIKGQLVGMVSQINKRFHHIVISPSLSLIKEYITQLNEDNE